MPSRPAIARRRKPAQRYHHGDLPRAMVAEAVRIIQKRGIDGLTLRAVGEQLGVSRTALYRHFTNKQALLNAVGAEGFITLREALLRAWEHGGQGHPGFEAMAGAYVHFAVEHPAHYRVMFGGAFQKNEKDCQEAEAAGNAFQALVDALAELQRRGLARPDDPRRLAQYIWAVVHGIAMLAVDGMVSSRDELDRLLAFACERVRTGILPPA